MANSLHRLRDRVELTDGRMVLGLTGWMDGGETSIGTVDYLVSKLSAKEIAQIDPESFYIYSFPGSMEVSALFRPSTKIEDGLVTEYEEPMNTFYCCERENLVLFKGKEPNFQWREYAECIFSLAASCNVTQLCFAGSVAGIVPHTREPRFFGSVSDPGLKPLLEQHGLSPSSYEGPASLVTYLTTLCRRKGIEMVTLVAEVPAYVQGRNVKCIASVARKVAAILDLEIDLDDLRVMGVEFEKRLSEIVKEKPELAELLRKIEHDYDTEIHDTQADDLKEWFEKQNIRLN